MASFPQKLLLAAPRGYCAGVDRAVQTVERALELYGAPVYVRKEIVHNKHVVEQLRDRGAVFVDSETEVPEGATVVFSAHGVAPSVHSNAQVRELHTIDATCPLVTKVHVEAKKFAAEDYTIVLVGHAGHEEVEGTTGEAPDSTFLIESIADAERFTPPQTQRLAYLTQTTLSVDETDGIIATLRRRFPDIEAPKREDICYATTNRQRAVKAILREIDLLLVIGSRNSSNSNRLVEVARSRGVAAHLIDDETDIQTSWFAGVETLGLTSGASVPESLVRRVLSWFRERGVQQITAQMTATENVAYRPPAELKQQMAASP
jgi:4-hydroxy-3-methylbut-2-en-1-yl diphosphate reductase